MSKGGARGQRGRAFPHGQRIGIRPRGGCGGEKGSPLREETSREDHIREELHLLRERVCELEDGGARGELAAKTARLGEKYFQSLIEHSMELITILDRDGKITYESPSVSGILGYGEDELLGVGVLELMHPEDLERAKAVLARVLEDPPVVVPLKYRLRHAEGSWRVLDGRCRSIRDEDGTQTVIINSRDNTWSDLLRDELARQHDRLEELVAKRTAELERVNERLRYEIGLRARAEEELQRRERYYRALIENSYGVIAVLELDGMLRFVSPSVKQVFGYEPDEIPGRRISELTHPDDVTLVMRTLAEAPDDPALVTSVEFRLMHKDGSWRLCEASGRKLLHDPAVRGVVVYARDVTAQRAMERSLRESEEKFRLISEQSMMGIMIIQDGRFKYMNQAASGIYGYPVEEVLGWGRDELAEAIHPDDREFVLEQLAKKQSGEEGQVANYAMRIFTSAGEERHIEVYSSTVYYDDRPADLIASVDITDRVRMDAELKEREERFRSLIENSHDVMVVVDERGTITYVSPSVQRVLGYAPEEVVRSEGFSFLREDDLEAAARGLEFLLANPGETLTGEFHARHSDGSWRDVEVTASNFLHHPSVKGLVVNYRDVTDRKSIRQRLESINHLFLSLGADLFENMEKIVEACRDMVGGELAAYCRLEKDMFTVLSTSEGEDGFFVTDQPDRMAAWRAVSMGMSEPLVEEDLSGSPFLETDPLITAHGLRSFVGYPVWQKWRAVGCLCLFHKGPHRFTRDEVELVGILARALAVEEERMDQEQSLKDFVDVASHELRHPITLMKGYALTLGRYGDRLDEKARREYLGIINQGADRLDLLIRELLDAARIERGRFSPQRRAQDLEPLLRRAVKEMKDKGCPQALSVELRGELAPRAVDAEKLVRVLVILLDNASAHSPAGCEIEVTAEERDGEALVAVSDHGEGVPEKARELIFGRFYQVEDALHHTTRGMGLGLYIAKEIVEAHGGRIWHEHNDGGGSVFRFTVP